MGRDIIIQFTPKTSAWNSCNVQMPSGSLRDLGSRSTLLCNGTSKEFIMFSCMTTLKPSNFKDLNMELRPVVLTIFNESYSLLLCSCVYNSMSLSRG